MGLFRLEYWSGVPFPPPGDLCDPGLEPVTPVAPELAGGFFTAEPLGIPMSIIRILFQFVDYIFVYVLWSQYEENGLQGEKYWLRPWTVKLEILGLRHFPTVGRFWKFLLLSKPIGFLPHHLHPTDSR